MPVRAHVLAGVLVTAVTLANYTRGMGDLYAFVAAVSLAAGMLAYFASALAGVVLLRGDAAGRMAGLAAAGFIAWLSWGLGWEANGWALVLLLAGVPVFWWVRRGGAGGRSKLRSFRISCAALCPGAPVTPPPGWALPDPHTYSAGTGAR
ncbi:hypothetical protein AB5I41_12985 [Sphingomonas sp. MMS24-JH45]